MKQATVLGYVKDCDAKAITRQIPYSNLLPSLAKSAQISWASFFFRICGKTRETSSKMKVQQPTDINIIKKNECVGMQNMHFIKI